MSNSARRERQPLENGHKLWFGGLLVIFALPGFAFASWVSRTTTIRDQLDASTSQMGFLLLGLATGSIVGLTGSGRLISRLGARRSIAASTMLLALGFIAAGAGTAVALAPVIFAGLLIFGIGYGVLDVAMNVEGGSLEQALGRNVMPLLHALFSLGMLLGALAGTAAIAAQLPVSIHLAAVGLALGGGVYALSRCLPPATGREAAEEREADVPGASRASGARLSAKIWREPRVWMIGLIVLGAAFSEGAASDWIPLAMVDGYGVEAATGSLVYGFFVGAMLVARLAGGYMLDRFGRVAVLRGCAALSVAGLLVFIFGSGTAAAATGAVLWGLGASVGFPVGLSAAGDEPRGAAARVSAVAMIGYFAFLVGPPSLGLLGEQIGLRRAMLVVLAMVLLAGLLSHAARKPRRSGAPEGR
ncbi:MFS transporter [Paenibacillus sp. IB182496]|uniref:MFS transporter n=1 Tax=Paenibacillus sabuli TaxID=2772509 RepID=A0A927BVL9_9BACL|nr:MFS transporter [Paenibacillus sabuli]MBD2846294.1 MFS transporter [Paenibacillus sabuli]